MRRAVSRGILGRGSRPASSGRGLVPGRVAMAALAGVAMACVALWVSHVTVTSFESDGFFFLATGRELAERGLPATNVWATDPALGIVVQQWAHVLVYWKMFEALGWAGPRLLVPIMLAFALTCAHVAIRECSGGRVTTAREAIVLLPLVTLLSSYLVARPQIWTMGLALLCAAACERARWRRDARWLLPLPAIMCLHMQLHMALAWLDVCVVGCWAVWGFVRPALRRLVGCRDDGRPKGLAWWWYALAMATMAVASATNPYGADGSLYLVRSFGVASYRNAIIEMKPIWALGAAAAVDWATRSAWSFAVPVILARAWGRSLRGELVVMAAAGCVAALLQARNGWMAPVLAVPLWSLVVGMESPRVGRGPTSDEEGRGRDGSDPAR